VSVAAVIGLGVWVVMVAAVAYDEARRERKKPTPPADPIEPAIQDFHKRQSYNAVGPDAYREQLRPWVRDA
jgi:hypothetical protein